METIVIVLSVIIFILVLGIIVHVHSMNKPFKFDASNLGQYLGKTTALNPGEYMDRSSSFILNDGTTVMGTNFSFKKHTDTRLAYLVCREDGIYFLDDNFDILLRYKLTTGLVAGGSNDLNYVTSVINSDTVNPKNITIPFGFENDKIIFKND